MNNNTSTDYRFRSSTLGVSVTVFDDRIEYAVNVLISKRTTVIQIGEISSVEVPNSLVNRVHVLTRSGQEYKLSVGNGVARESLMQAILGAISEWKRKHE